MLANQTNNVLHQSEYFSGFQNTSFTWQHKAHALMKSTNEETTMVDLTMPRRLAYICHMATKTRLPWYL